MEFDTFAVLENGFNPVIEATIFLADFSQNLRRMVMALCLAFLGLPATGQTLAENNAAMLQQMQTARGLSGAEMARIRAIFANSPWIGQGNPAVTKHPLTPQQLAQKLGADPKAYYRNTGFERICGEKFMAPLYDPATETAADARAGPVYPRHVV